jgi:hypothetical protein
MSEIRVGFRGAGGGEGELTWGQLGIWRTVQRTGRTMNLTVIVPLPGGTAVERIAAELRFVVSRHPALRTRLRFAGGASGPRHPRQAVAESGEVPLHIVDIGAGDDAAEAAEELRSRYELTPFDYENEFPVRMGVVRQAGTLGYVVVGYSHVMVDGGAMIALARDLGNLDPATGEATAPARGLNPLELARFQGSPAGRRQTGRCMRYWQAQLERLPSWQPGEPAGPREPRFWELVGSSPAMELGLQAVAARTKAATGHVLLAAYAVAVARVMGRNPNVVQTVVNNRFRPGFADTISQLSQLGICVIDVAGATFDQVVDRAQTAAASASFYGYYDSVQYGTLLDDLTAQLGRPLDISWLINDRRGIFGPRPGGSAPTGAQLKAALRGALPRTKLYWDRKQPTFDSTLFIQADSRPDLSVPGRVSLNDGLPAVYLEIWIDTHHFAVDQIEAFGREMEAVVVAAALDPAVPSGIPQPHPGHGSRPAPTASRSPRTGSPRARS